MGLIHLRGHMSDISQRATNIAQVKVIANMLTAMMSAADTQPTLEARRAGYDAWGLAYPLPDGATCEAIQLGGVPTDKITVVNANPATALLYLHGGGYGIGSAQSHRHLVGQLCAGSGLVGYNVDYRLAPETAFPGAVDDALAAYRALLEQGIASAKIIISGDSAGGGLTVACALAIKAAGLPQPAGLFVMSPWVNLTQTGASYDSKAEADFICTKTALQDWSEMYLARVDAKNPLASPIFGDLGGLAPLLIHVGSEEVLLSDSVALAQTAGMAQVDVTLDIAADMPHVYHYMWASVDEGKRGIAAACKWMKARIG
jgi:epsilon-lactone hydrolase